MSSDKAREAAIQILKDRNDADYFRDTTFLAQFIQSSLNSPEEVAQKIAVDLNNDRRGPNFYADEKILAVLLDSRMVETE